MSLELTSFQMLILEALPLLVRVIQSADAKTKENINATENCISAVGKMMKFKPDCVNVEEVLPHWLSWLPLHEDKEEAVQTFNYLCDLIERWAAGQGSLTSFPFVQLGDSCACLSGVQVLIMLCL